MFLDTSGLFVMLHGQDPNFARGRDLTRTARQLVTHNGILAEFVALCITRGLPGKQALGFLRDLEREQRLRLHRIDLKLHQEAISLLEHRLDKKYSLVDAVSFDVMRRTREREAPTTDHHFGQEGFIVLLMP